jgi:hypothetical protein
VAAKKSSAKVVAAARAENRDNRSASRRSCVQFVWYCSVEDATKRGLARTVDVSAGGLGLVTTHKIARGEKFFVVVVTRFGRVNVLARAMHVQDVEPDSCRVGLQIEIIPPTDKPVWQRLLQEEPR